MIPYEFNYHSWTVHYLSLYTLHSLSILWFRNILHLIFCSQIICFTDVFFALIVYSLFVNQCSCSIVGIRKERKKGLRLNFFFLCFFGRLFSNIFFQLFCIFFCLVLKIKHSSLSCGKKFVLFLFFISFFFLIFSAFLATNFLHTLPNSFFVFFCVSGSFFCHRYKQ